MAEVSVKGVYLKNLTEGSVLDVATKSRHYRVEYRGGDEILVSGHPVLCPDPIPAHLLGSLGRMGLEPGYIGQGLRMEFERASDAFPVITSEVQEVTEIHA